MLKKIKCALILTSAFSISGCGIIGYINSLTTTKTNVKVTRADNSIYAALTSDNSLFISNDGESWNQVTIPKIKANWNNIISITNRLFIVGLNGAIAVSNDGHDWSALDVHDYRLWLYDLAYLNKRYVAVGIGGLSATSRYLNSWEINEINSMSWFTAVATSESQFVACGSRGEIVYSQDGLKWLNSDSITSNWLSDIEYLNGTFYAVGANGTIISSQDAEKWTDLSLDDKTWIYAIAKYNNNLIAVGDKSTIVTTPIDQQNDWHKQITNVPVNTTLRTVMVDTNNKIYIAGQYGYVASSTDMHTWTAHHLNTNSTILQIVQLKKIDPQ